MQEPQPLQLQKLNYGRSFHKNVIGEFDNVFIDLYTRFNKLIYVSEIRRFTQFSLSRLNLSWISFLFSGQPKWKGDFFRCLLLWEK